MTPKNRQGANQGHRLKLRRLGKGLLASSLVVVIGLVVAEWYLRKNTAHFLGTPAAAHRMLEQDDAGTIQLTAGWRGKQLVDGRLTTITINSDGMRGPEVGPPQPTEKRVIVLGDSFVFGHGVGDQETFCFRLQQRLNDEMEVSVVVGNAGVSGFGTREFARSYERHAGFGADVVVACVYIGNDFDGDAELYRTVIEGYWMQGPPARLARTSWRMRLSLRFRVALAFEKFLSNHLEDFAVNPSTFERTPEEEESFAFFPPPPQRFAGLFMDRRESDDLVKKILRTCEVNIGRLRDLVQPRPLLVVIIPTWWHLTPDRWRVTLEEKGMDPLTHEYGLTQERLLDLLANMGIEALDLTPLLRSGPEVEERWLPNDKHFSAEGHTDVAAWLLPLVKTKLEGGVTGK